MSAARSQGGFEVVVGLEVHLQLDTRSKLFTGVSADYFGLPPNSNTDPFTLGLPGTLPVVNRQAVELAIQFGLALHCDVLGFTQFHRKNYFYPDSPRNYQTSQYDRPIARDGYLDVNGERIRVKRAHLEDDAGKSLHPEGSDATLVDLNRAGVPLIEMVTEPDIHTAEQARAFLEKVQAIAQALGVSDATPEEGKMRCDVNVSLRRAGEPLGTKVEVKNLNSFRSVQRSLEFEINRQAAVLSSGGRVTQDTVGWDETAGRTYLMRTKEGESDYRYFPDPDLPPLVVTPEWAERLRSEMARLPDEKAADYVASGVRASDAELIAGSRSLSAFFEAARAGLRGPAQDLANWLTGDVTGLLNARGERVETARLTPAALTGLVNLVADGVISGKTAKDL
ncbi:MAG TPA: Asp-tRNA(Asn)/Glu-tRNA(Gln) amidotransferase subunit GatB, partial [Deinococcales bacterium]|nr:Asp-tRNA(Asn)/Glu-tRNA(Gln) amidotransferase subunit GatB [Deinococcales bacterium]